MSEKEWQKWGGTRREVRNASVETHAGHAGRVIEYIFLLIEKYCRLTVTAGNFMETGFNYTKSRRTERYN